MNIENLDVGVDGTDADARTDLERQIDAVIGAKGTTELDKQFGRVMKHAAGLFLNNKALRKYLLLGEECDLYVSKCVDLGVKRALVVSRLEERLHEAGLGQVDIRVNDWVAVYGLARCVTGADTVKDMPAEFVSAHAYRTLAILKAAVERDETTYTFKAGWADKAMKLLRDGVKGRRLEEAVKAHGEYVKELERTNRMESLSPEKRHAAEMKELAEERDRKTRAVTKAAESLRDKANELNLTPDELVDHLVNRGIITPPEPVRTPMDCMDMANAMTPDDAAGFAKALCDRGNIAVINTLASILVGYLKEGQAERKPEAVYANA